MKSKHKQHLIKLRKDKRSLKQAKKQKERKKIRQIVKVLSKQSHPRGVQSSPIFKKHFHKIIHTLTKHLTLKPVVKGDE